MRKMLNSGDPGGKKRLFLGKSGGKITKFWDKTWNKLGITGPD